MDRPPGNHIHPGGGSMGHLPPMDDAFCKRYEKLIRHIAGRLGFAYGDIEGMGMEDAMQAGYIGLLEAYRTFDPEKVRNARNPFAFWAGVHIRREIIEELRSTGWFKESRVTFPVLSRDFEEDEGLSDVERLVAEQEWLERVDQAIERMPWHRKQFYAAVMRHDDAYGHGKRGFQPYHALGYTNPEVVSQMRRRIRKDLKEQIH